MDNHILDFLSYYDYILNPNPYKASVIHGLSREKEALH